MKKPVVKLNPQEADGVTRRGRGTRDTPKFRVGQVVFHKRRKAYVKIAGLRSWQFTNGGVIFTMWPEPIPVAAHHCVRKVLRPLTKRERGVEPQP